MPPLALLLAVVLFPFHTLRFVCYARQAHASGFAKTFAVQYADVIAAQYSLFAGQVDPVDPPERMRKSMDWYPIPAVVLAWLACGSQQLLLL